MLNPLGEALQAGLQVGSVKSYGANFFRSR